MEIPVKLKQMGWLVLLWTGGMLSLFVLAYIIRIVMTMAGLKS